MAESGRPKSGEYGEWYERYVALVPETDIVAVLTQQVEDLRRLAANVGPEKELYRYAPGKWTVREVISHVIDGERVFGYRAFCISRGEKASLPSFDENTYAAASDGAGRPLKDIVEEFALVRGSNLVFLTRLTGGAWDSMGTASAYPASVRGIAYTMAGHARHHLKILRERYGLT